MTNFSRKVEKIMTQKEAGKTHKILTFFLSAISFLYGVGVQVRNRLFDRGLRSQNYAPCPVISVGNITVGGTGKTPMVMYLALLAQSLGVRVAVVSRGYGGSCQKTGGVVSDTESVLLGPSEAGDEPYLMACKLPGIPVVVGRDRSASANICNSRFHSQLILLDDGFQHRTLHRDLDFVLLHAVSPFGNGLLFPRGTLREPAKNIARAHAVVMTRATSENVKLTELGQRYGKPVFFCNHEPFGLVVLRRFSTTLTKTANPDYDLSFLSGKSVFVFAGIAENQSFFSTIKSLGANVCGTSNFADHYPYSKEDCQEIFQKAKACGAELVVTTEKDMVRLPFWDEEKISLVALEIRIQFLDEKRFVDFFKDRLLKIQGTRF